MNSMKVFKDYFVSSQNAVLIPNADFGRRKFINVGLNRSLSASRIEEISDQSNVEMRSSASKQWMHPPDALVRGHIMYTVKFLGESEVDAPKGTDVVKDAIRKRKFNKSMRKAEGQRTPKVDISISVNGVSIVDPKTRIVKYQYPLHRISYCADDKADKRMFSFIAKAADKNQHFCYVFASDRNAEEITLTIGQAFDLAYRRFLETPGRGGDQQNQLLLLQKQVQTLEKENETLKTRIRKLELLKDRADIESFKQDNQIGDLTSVTFGKVITIHNPTGESTSDSPPGTPKHASVGRKLENLVFNDGKPQTNGFPSSPATPGLISPPPPPSRTRASSHRPTPTTPAPPMPPPEPPAMDTHEELASVFMSATDHQHNITNNNAFNPFNPAPDISAQGSTDPFGMPTFNPNKSAPPGNFNTTDYMDLQAGFTQGLSFGTEEFNMDDFDPLNQSQTK